MNRPMPPAELLDPWVNRLARAKDVEEWIRVTFIDAGSTLENPDHDHLGSAEIGVLWASAPAKANGMQVVGMAEMPQPRGKAWVKHRQEYQLVEWFGDPLPDFVITLWAPYAMEADDISWCALVEHELYHCGQAEDQYGSPRFNSQTGAPVWTMKGHDVEEFVPIVRRYGGGAAAGQTAALIRAGNQAPLIGVADVAGACGTCARKVA